MTNKWWGGFKPFQHIVFGIEDFPNDAKYMGQLVKIWADCYAFQGETKGSSLYISPAWYILIINSNYPIEECFKDGDVEDIQACFFEIKINDSISSRYFKRTEWDIMIYVFLPLAGSKISGRRTDEVDRRRKKFIYIYKTMKNYIFLFLSK